MSICLECGEKTPDLRGHLEREHGWKFTAPYERSFALLARYEELQRIRVAGREYVLKAFDVVTRVATYRNDSGDTVQVRIDYVSGSDLKTVKRVYRKLYYKVRGA
ncbi:MAG: hypothetical protein ACXQT3_01520 [Methermicoccaceae archaeon]